MLSQTKEQVQQILNKIQVLDFALDTLARTHKDDTAKAEELFKRASTHKLKLVEEMLRLSNATEIAAS